MVPHQENHAARPSLVRSFAQVLLLAFNPLLAACPCRSVSEYNVVDPYSPDWGIGLTEPTPLLQYKHWDNAPRYCHKPDTVLFELQSAISQNDGNCESESTEDATGLPVLEIICRLVDPEDSLASDETSCGNTYIANIWTERKINSTTDYKIVGFSWVRRTCREEGFAPPVYAKRFSTGVSGRIQKFINQCRRL